MSFGALSFLTPWLLLGLIALPVLWILLRAVPPAPVRRRFPAVALLLGLKDKEVETDRTPWWLLLLRILAAAALILGFAGPFWDPDKGPVSSAPLLVVMDGGWAEAPDWTVRRNQALAALDEAGRTGRDTAILLLSDPERDIQFAPSALTKQKAGALNPRAWLPSDEGFAEALESLPNRFDTLWLASPVTYDAQPKALQVFEAAGAVTVLETGNPVIALRPAELTADGVVVTALRRDASGLATREVIAEGPDPAGIQRELARVDLTFEPGALQAEVTLDLAPELRDRVTRFRLADVRSAGAVTLSDDRLKRREIALVAPGAGAQEGLALLSELHFVRQALVPTSDLIDAAVADILQANPDTIILADVPRLAESQGVLDWVEKGGLLLRFAGPRVAADVFDATEEDPLMPVRLRAGGRTVGGAMSWGAPKTLRAFPVESPFYGLPTPEEVTIRAQVLAEPDPDLSNRVIARLEDGTPLVTQKSIGDGKVVLFHVTANAEWSNLPISGLFVQMLERLSLASGQGGLDAPSLDGTRWTLTQALDGFGNLSAQSDQVAQDGAELATAPLNAMAPPGLYAGEDRLWARNVVAADDALVSPNWPTTVRVVGLEEDPALDLMPWLLLAAFVLASVDILASLWVGGKFAKRGGSVVAFLLVGVLVPIDARADDSSALYAATEVVLAYVITGDAAQDQKSRAGLQGISQTLYTRTAIEPVTPVGVDLMTDDISLYPFLYWPITLNQDTLTEVERTKINRFMRSGGMILFDTRDGDVAGFGQRTAEARKLQEIAQGLNIPPLSPIPEDHVLTRTFYLIQDFPGRHLGQTIWVEATPDAEALATEGMPFRNLNDGVTPVVIGGNDWAAAWATNADGMPLFPIGRGFSGDRQREVARRFGVNLIMHVLTGNYKSDQVHVPALLDRLGQ